MGGLRRQRGSILGERDADPLARARRFVPSPGTRLSNEQLAVAKEVGGTAPVGKTLVSLREMWWW